MAKTDSKKEFRDPTAGPIFSPRFVIALLLIALGIAWIVYYYIVVRVDPTIFPEPKPGGPARCSRRSPTGRASTGTTSAGSR